METEYQKDNAEEPFLIDTVYSEFNSGAWLVDLEVFTPPVCPAPPPPSAVKRSLGSFKAPARK